MRLRIWIIAALAPSLLFAEKFDEGEKLFALKIKPLFAEKCNACHGDEPDKIKGDFDMRTRESILKGGEYWADDVVHLEKGDESYLYILTTRSEEEFEMPPKEADALTEEQQWAIRDWIDAGAPWPDDERIAAIQEKYAEGVQVTTSKALSEEWQNRRYESEKLWAYRPLNVSEIPEGESPVDWFIDRKLAKAKLEPAPDARAIDLVRRIRFGFTGLPPTPEEVAEFESNYAENAARAVAQYAEELMATPHYGEHFAAHWLDVTRYADSAGFANDYARPNAWRYRDYVVRAFNEDKPYPEFVREQLAGDEIDPNDPEMLIATGFLRMGPWEQTGMSVFKETRQMWLDDVTDSVGQTFLAHAMQCAKCHDHKFDPVPTRDYYSMMAVFSTTQFAEREAPFLASESKRNFAERSKWIDEKLKRYAQQGGAIGKKIKERKKSEKGPIQEGDTGLDPGDEASKARIGKNITRHKIEKDGVLPLAHSVYTGKTIERKNVQGKIAMPTDPWSRGEMEKDAILTGGNVYSPAEPVTPGALSAAESLGEMETKPFPAGKGKRRLALANWIVDEKNPLTARVMVNRVWSWHFGKGLAGNPNNFGGTGLAPTHPQLLDYLANWFMENGWSVKKLNRLIVESKAYRRSSIHPDALVMRERDPHNAFYASFAPRRLTAEEFRDAMLATSGEMNPEVGGIPARPDINPEVAVQPRQIMGGTASVYEPDPKPEMRNRRTLYTERVRGLRDPFLEIFNQPGPDNSCELRETSTVAPQALTLFNSEEVRDRAIAFADRLVKENRDDEETIQRAFELALARSPNETELRACLDHWKSATATESGKTYQSQTFPNQIERTVMAEKTGEPYDFIEFMPAYADYEPDLQMTGIDAKTRGLSHVCLVLFNLNEFGYID